MTKISKISSALAGYEPYYERILRTGSRVICSPPSDETDEDYLVLVTPENRILLETQLQADDWVLGGSLPNSGPLDGDWVLNTVHEYEEGRVSNRHLFHSWKRRETPAVYDHQHGESTDPFSILSTVVTPSEGPEINLLVTCNESYFDDFTRATFLCQGLNLLDKSDRVMVFEALTRDVWPTGRKKKKSPFLFKESYGRPAWMDTIPMTAWEINQLQQAQAEVNPPIMTTVFPGAAGTQWFDENGNLIPIEDMEAMNNVLPPIGPNQTVTMMNGMVIHN